MRKANTPALQYSNTPLRRFSVIAFSLPRLGWLRQQLPQMLGTGGGELGPVAENEEAVFAEQREFAGVAFPGLDIGGGDDEGDRPAFEKGMKHPDGKGKIEKMGFVVEYKSPDELRKLIIDDYETAKGIAVKLGLGK